MVDVDAAGAVAGAVHGGGLGAAVEKPAGKAGQAQHICTDCGAEIHGRFCSSCGQPCPGGSTPVEASSQRSAR